jgi:hypothetical protein
MLFSREGASQAEPISEESRSPMNTLDLNCLDVINVGRPDNNLDGESNNCNKGYFLLALNCAGI